MVRSAAGAGLGKSRPAPGREVDLWYSEKNKDFGGNIQGLFCPDGLPAWILGVLPGNVHDLAAARENVLPVLRDYTDEMPALADCRYEGSGHGVLTPVKRPKGVTELDIDARTREYAAEFGEMPGRRCFVLLSQRWKTLQNVIARRVGTCNGTVSYVKAVRRGQNGGLPGVASVHSGSGAARM